MSYVLSVALSFFFAAAWSAQANQPPRYPCMSVGDLQTQLSQYYAETARGQGVSGHGALLQLYRSADDLTWTVILVRGDGFACVMAAGKGWEDIAAPLAGKPM